jgi:putative N6-adenine-specific DNA methylase
MAPATDTIEFFASAAPGSEEAVRDELSELGFRRVRLNRGGIPFFGDWAEGWRACFESRTAQRIMAVMGRFPAADAQGLYDGVRQVDWSPFLGPDHTLAVSAFVHSSAITHSGFAALRVKDAIVDQLRDRGGRRPDVQREDPDVRVFLYLVQDRATLYIDLAGEALFRRGYRTGTGEAPLKETLAAVVLRLAGWDRETPLVDPMCGSGTLAIEAALWAGSVPPGLLRTRFGFERWAGFDAAAAAAVARLRGELRQQAHGQHPGITAMDADAAVLEQAKTNARQAGVHIRFRQAQIRDLRPDGGAPRLLVANPPYGERLEADNRLYQEMATALRRLSGWRLALLAGSPRLAAAMAIRPTRRYALRNGDLPCELLVYDLP